jgi:hypothetical protein
MRYKLLAILIVLPLSGCAGNSLLSSPRNQFLVDSAPVGASVLVLGETMGQTPLNVRTRDVFPQSFDPKKQHLYGRVELTYPGCEPFITTVSSRVISEGLNARLTCREQDRPQEPTTAMPQATSTPQAKPLELKQRLQQLKELFEEGLISEQDYATKRHELLNAL